MKIHRLLGFGEIPSLMLGAGHPNRKGSVSFNRGLRYAHPNPPPMYLKASFFAIRPVHRESPTRPPITTSTQQSIVLPHDAVCRRRGTRDRNCYEFNKCVEIDNCRHISYIRIYRGMYVLGTGASCHGDLI